MDARSAQTAMGVLRRYIMGGSAFVLVLCFIAAFFLASWIADPLLSLAEQARRVQAGDLAKPVEETRRKDETDLVAQVLEQMRKDLSQLVARVNEVIAGIVRQAEAVRQFAESLDVTPTRLRTVRSGSRCRSACGFRRSRAWPGATS